MTVGRERLLLLCPSSFDKPGSPMWADRCVGLPPACRPIGGGGRPRSSDLTHPFTQSTDGTQNQGRSKLNYGENEGKQDQCDRQDRVDSGLADSLNQR